MVTKIIPQVALTLLLILFLAIFSISIVFYPVFAVLLFLAVVIFLCIYIKPLLGLIFTVVMTPLFNMGIILNSPYRKIHEYVYFVFIPVIITLISYFLNKLVKHKTFSTKKINNINILFFLLICWIAISLIWTIDILHGLHTLLAVIVCITILYIFEGILTKKEDVQKLLNIFPIIGIVLGLSLLLSKEFHKFIIIESIDNIITYHITSDPTHGVPKVSIYAGLHTLGITITRPGGFAPPNAAANILSLFIFVDIALFYAASNLKRVMLLAHILFLTICLFMTASKSGAGGLLFGLIAFSLIVPESRKRFIKIYGVSFILIGILFIIAGDALLKRLKIMLSSKGLTEFINTRLNWWSKGFSELWDSYGLGIGAGGFPKLIDPIPLAHSFYFSIPVELGIIGLLLFSLILFLKLDKIIKSIPMIKDRNLKFISYSLICALISFFIYGLTDIDYTYYPFWLFLGLITSVVNIGILTTDNGNTKKISQRF